MNTPPPFQLTFARFRPEALLETASALAGHLGASGRVFRLDDGTPALFEPAAGAVRPLLGPSGRAEGAADLLTLAGLVSPDTDPRSETLARRWIDSFFASGTFTAHLPRVESCVRLPAVRLSPDRLSLVTCTEGYDAAAQALYLPDSALGSGSLDGADPTCPHLRALWSGLLFADPLHLANLIGITVACVARHALRRFPLLLVEAAQKGSGKSAVVEALGHLVTGRPPLAIIYTGSEDEFETRVGTQLSCRPGPVFAFVDNVRSKRGQHGGQVRSQLLSSATSGHAVAARALYRGPQPVWDPIFVLSMNAGRVEADLADKTVPVTLRLPPGLLHRPLVPHPVEYAAEHRAALLAECLRLLTHLILPAAAAAAHSTRFYAFEDVVLRSAALLGLRASFASDSLSTADSLALELAQLLLDEHGGGPTHFDVLVRTVWTSGALHETMAFLGATHRGRTGQCEALREHITHTFADRPLRLSSGLVGSFVVDKNGDRGYTLSFKEINTCPTQPPQLSSTPSTLLD